MNKKVLTIKKIKRVNRTSGIISIFVVGSISIFAVFGISSLIDSLKQGQTSGMALLGPIMFIGIPLLISGMVVKNAIRDAKENKFIDNGEFKVVEDVIYKRNTYTTRDSDGYTTRHYEFYTNLYGRISINSKSYNYAKRGDFIYLVVYNDKRSADQGYLSTLYELSDELKPYFVPYEEEAAVLDKDRIINRKQYYEKQDSNTWWDE